jgi:lactoylglutathione lyase
MPTKGLAHIGVYTRDIDTSVAFYKKLGFEFVNVYDRGNKLCFIRLEDLLVELIQPADQSRLEGLGGGIIAHFAIEVKGIEELVEGFKAEGLISADAKINSSENMGGSKNTFMTGPMGERIELLEYTNKA